MNDIPANKHPLNKLAASTLKELGATPEPGFLHLLQLAKWALEHGLGENPQMSRMRRPLIDLADNLMGRDPKKVMDGLVALQGLSVQDLRAIDPEQRAEEAMDLLMSKAVAAGWEPQADLRSLNV